MNFEEAVKNISVNATSEDRSVDVIIFFETKYGLGSASLNTKRYFRYPEETLKVVERAWRYAVKADPDRENGIISIEVRPKVEIVAPPRMTNKKISA